MTNLQKLSIASMLCVCVALTGCMSSPTLIQINDAEGGLIRQIKLTPDLYGRGCLAFTVSPDGEVEMLAQQDGTTDWIGIRILPAIGAEAVTAALAIVSAPFELIQMALGSVPEVPDPSAIHGCDGIFEEAVVGEGD